MDRYSATRCKIPACMTMMDDDERKLSAMASNCILIALTNKQTNKRMGKQLVNNVNF